MAASSRERVSPVLPMYVPSTTCHHVQMLICVIRSSLAHRRVVTATALDRLEVVVLLTMAAHLAAIMTDVDLPEATVHAVTTTAVATATAALAVVETRIMTTVAATAVRPHDGVHPWMTTVPLAAAEVTLTPIPTDATTVPLSHTRTAAVDLRMNALRTIDLLVTTRPVMVVSLHVMVAILEAAVRIIAEVVVAAAAVDTGNFLPRPAFGCHPLLYLDRDPSKATKHNNSMSTKSVGLGRSLLSHLTVSRHDDNGNGSPLRQQYLSQ